MATNEFQYQDPALAPLEAEGIKLAEKDPSLVTGLTKSPLFTGLIDDPSAVNFFKSILFLSCVSAYINTLFIGFRCSWTRFWATHSSRQLLLTLPRLKSFSSLHRSRYSSSSDTCLLSLLTTWMQKICMST